MKSGRATEQMLIILIAFGLAVSPFLLMAIFDWAGLDYRKWFAFVLWTAGVFGCLAYKYGKSLRRAKSLTLFVTMLALHVVVLTRYLHSAEKFPNVFFLFFSPFEAGVVALVLSGFGGAHVQRRRHRPPSGPGIG